MGYYSVMYVEDVIKSDFDVETINKMFDEYRNNFDGDHSDIKYYLNIYSFSDDGSGNIILEAEDFNAKHYADKELAVFISRILKDGAEFKMTFVGEDGERWGYLIWKGFISEIYWEERYGPPIPAEELYRKYLKAE